jgi:hypothetical protein
MGFFTRTNSTSTKQQKMTMNSLTPNRFFFPLTISTSTSGSWSDSREEQQGQRPAAKTLLQQFVKQHSPKNMQLPTEPSTKTETKKAKKKETTPRKMIEPTPFFLQPKESDKTEPVSSDSETSKEGTRLVGTSADNEVLNDKSATKSKTAQILTAADAAKISTAFARSRSGKSGRSLRSQRSHKKKSSSTHSRASTRRKKRSSFKVELPITTTISTTTAPSDKTNNPNNTVVSAVNESDLPQCIQLESDMLILADGMHLDRNTRMLLASFDAKTVEDFFMMGDVDFNRLLAKARTTNRSLPPLQIRKGMSVLVILGRRKKTTHTH